MITTSEACFETGLTSSSAKPDRLSMSELIREISRGRGPQRILRLFMNALESKRQAKGMGWSRPWNKYGLTIFNTHSADLEKDAPYFEPVFRLLDVFKDRIPEHERDFVRELLQDPECMAFVFYHHDDHESGQYEGLTFSFGRRHGVDKSKRDRLDIVIEDRLVGNRVDGEVDRLRFYICPWDRYQNGRRLFMLEQTSFDVREDEALCHLYQHAVWHYHEWKHDDRRRWNHWSQQYIDYFGKRQLIPAATSFH